MFQTNTRRPMSTTPRANPAAQRAEVARLTAEYGLEAFLNTKSPAQSEQPANPFESFPIEKPVAQAPVVVVVKRRRVLAVA